MSSSRSLIPVLDLGRLLWGEGLVILPRLLEEELGRGHIPLAIEEDALRRLPRPVRPARPPGSSSPRPQACCSGART